MENFNHQDNHQRVEEIILQHIQDFTSNQQIDHFTIKALIEHCLTIKNSKCFVEVKNLYKYKFVQKDDELYENFNKEGFGIKKIIPAASCMKSNEVELHKRNDKQWNYNDMTTMLSDNSYASLVLCSLNKKNSMCKFKDNLEDIKSNYSDAKKIDSCVVFTCGLNFTPFHVDTYAAKRISIIPNWNRGVYKIWIFYKGYGVRDKNFQRSIFNGFGQDYNLQIKHVLENYNLFDFYFQKPSEEIALIHDGSYLHSVLTIYDNKISKYGGCLSIGYRLIYKETCEQWIRHSQPRIGASNALTTRNKFIHAAYKEVSPHDAEKSAVDLIKSMDNNIAINAKKEKKRRRIAVSKRLNDGKRLKRELELRRGVHCEGMPNSNIF